MRGQLNCRSSGVKLQAVRGKRTALPRHEKKKNSHLSYKMSSNMLGISFFFDGQKKVQRSNKKFVLLIISEFLILSFTVLFCVCFVTLDLLI